MTKDAATPKQTSGSGFVFEDKVVAHYLVWMLAGTSPLKLPGPIKRIDCQVGVDGWDKFDDLLITTENNGTTHRCAYSLKSNLQFTKDAAPAAIIEPAWRLILHRESSVFDREHDRFGLISEPHPNPPKVAIQSLLLKANRQTPRQLADRLPVSGYASDVERDIHNSCACPSSLVAGLAADDALPGNILSKMSIIEHDFEQAESQSFALSTFLCSQLLTDGSSGNAGQLWNTACQLANSIRTSGGGLSRAELVSEIRQRHELRDLPDYAADWCTLSAWCEAELTAVRGSIAGTTVNRDTEAAKILGALDASRFVSMIGASGTGKSALAKRVAEEFQDVGDVLWLKAEQVKTGFIESLRAAHGLKHSLRDVLANGRCSRGLIILDSAERLADSSDYEELCILIVSLSLGEPGCPWNLLVTCREEAWDRFQFNASRALGQVIAWSPERIDYPAFESLEGIWSAFPGLRTLAVRPHLGQVMRNLKVLDLLACAIRTGRSPDAPQWVGESELIKWYWQHVVRMGTNGPRRAVILQEMAERIADTGRFEVPEAELSAADSAVLIDSTDLMLTNAERGVIFFAHDLIADWARFQALVSHQQDLTNYSKNRFANPRWHAAWRLYGVSLLETDPSGVRWKTALDQYPEAKDSLLESLVFAGNARGLLDNAWPVLVAEEGILLKSFLKRFQHVASIPNPQYMVLAGLKASSSDEASTWERLPLWMYWLSVLSCLSSHVDDLLRLCPTETARLARSWLKHTPHDWPGRSQASSLAVAVAKQAIGLGGYHHRPKPEGQLPYEALLEAYRDKPKEVSELLLKAAARIVPKEDDAEAFKDYQPPGTVTHMHSIIHGGDRIAQDPWPDGPLYRVDDSFRAACFDCDAMRTLMTNAPDLAREIVLSLLIERRPPKMYPDWSRDRLLPEDAVGLEHDHSFYPRFYTRGPFLLFLNIKPEAGISTIVRLIDFATERWMESQYETSARTIGVDLPLGDGTKRFVGDGAVYHWYHGVARSCITASALMALEKWLYDRLKAKEPVDDWINLILHSATSLAFLGMLSEVARHSPGLLTGVLRPLLLVPETYYFETIFAYQGGHMFGTPASFREGEWFFKLARDWDFMEHRKQRLVDVASYLFHRHKDTRHALVTAREQWKALPQESDEKWERYKQTLIATFDQNNWKEVELPDGSKGLGFQEPEYLRTPPAQLEQSEKRLLFLALPVTCRRILNGEASIQEDQAPAFLKQSKELLAFKIADSEVTAVSPAANGVLGTIAVLFLKLRKWLGNHPEEEAWCIKTLDEILLNPPPWREFDIPESVGDHDWEHFACEFVPVLWSEGPQTAASRERIASLVFAKHYSAVNILMQRAFEKRDVLKDDFWQLANLLLDWSIIRYELRDERWTGKKVDASKWVEKASCRFVAGKYRVDLPTWGENSIRDGKLWAANNHPHNLGSDKVHLLCRVPKIDTHEIMSGFSGIFLPDQATSDNERERFLFFWEQALATCLAGTQFCDENEHAIDPTLAEAGLPYDYDNWVLERMTLVVSQMRADEKPERFWQPILQLGSRAEHWVEHFLDHWFMDAKKSMATPRFIEACRRMVDYCLSSDSWVPQGGRSGFYLPSLWMSLVGLPRFTSSLWQDEEANIVGMMGDCFIKIAPHVLGSARDAVHFVSWLTDPSASQIRTLLLKPVADAAMTGSEYWWNEEHIAKVIARYLSLLWTEHGRSIEHNEAQKEIFLQLLHRAASTQEPLAMELQARIARA